MGKENNIPSGTIFILTGEYIGYNISPFSCYKYEEEILLEPETKILIKDEPIVSENIITIRCEDQKTKIILEDFFLRKKTRWKRLLREYRTIWFGRKYLECENARWSTINE